MHIASFFRFAKSGDQSPHSKGAVALLLALLLAAPAPGEESKPAGPPAETPARKVDRAKELFDQGKRDEAVKFLNAAADELQAACKDRPGDADAAFHYARALLYLGRDEEAVASVDRAIQLNSKEPEYRLLKGSLLAYLDRHAEAADEVRKAIELAPKNPEYRYELARVCLEGNKPSEAEAAYREALKLDPKHARALIGLGAAMVEQDREDEGLEYFLQAIRADPKSLLAQYNAGQIYQNREKYDEASKHFAAVLAIEPGDFRALAKMVQLSQALGRTKERDQYRERLFELHQQGKAQQPYFCREQFRLGDKRVMALEYFEMTGERAMRYRFEVLDKTGRDRLYFVSLGSYGLTNQIARETGDLKPGERLFHLDYYDKEGHRTYAMYRSEPGYEDTRKAVVEVIEGKRQPISSSSGPAAKPEEKK